VDAARYEKRQRISVVAERAEKNNCSGENKMNFLSGKKTYVVVMLGIVVYGAEAMGIVPEGTAEKLNGFLLLLGLGTLRSAVAKK
jgi:hypothetical protein